MMETTVDPNYTFQFMNTLKEIHDMEEKRTQEEADQ